MKIVLLLIGTLLILSMSMKKRSVTYECIQGRFVYELNGDSCLLNYWGQNNNEFPKLGLWSWSTSKGVNFKNGFYCFGQTDFEDSILFNGKYLNATDYRLDQAIYAIAISNDSVIDYSQSKKATKILKELNSVKVRKENFSMYTIFHPITQSNLKYRFGFVNVKMKVERIEKFDIERCIFNPRRKRNFELITIPYYRIKEIDSIW